MDVGALQERAARAQPAPVEERRGGDLLRATHDASSWWVGASLLHGTGPLGPRVDAVVDLAARSGAPARVQVCPSCPPGRVVVEDGWAGVFGMRTASQARRRGAAAAVLGGLAGWALAHGAPRLYLQVTADNGAALALYRSCGFGRAATYHYRTSRQAPTSRAGAGRVD